jgi:hypothetical protein
MKDKNLLPFPDGTAFLALDDVPIAGFSAWPQVAGSGVEIVLPTGRVLRGLCDVSDRDLARLITVVEIA